MPVRQYVRKVSRPWKEGDGETTEHEERRGPHPARLVAECRRVGVACDGALAPRGGCLLDQAHKARTCDRWPRFSLRAHSLGPADSPNRPIGLLNLDLVRGRIEVVMPEDTGSRYDRQRVSSYCGVRRAVSGERRETFFEEGGVRS